MNKLACVLALLMVAGPAAAAPTASVEVGPDDQPDSFYLRVNASEPEAPRNAKPTDDCAARARPPGTEQAAREIVAHYAAQPVPFTESGTTYPYVPRCVAAPISLCSDGACMGPAPAYASYNVTSGRYYVELDVPRPVLPVGQSPASGHADLALTGTTGASAEGDCATCPPPWV